MRKKTKKANLDGKSGKTPLWAILLVVMSTLLNSVGQYFLKKGITNVTSLMQLINPDLMVGFGLYGISAIVLILALKYGSLSVLYPVIAVGFIWVALMGSFLLHEQITILNWVGIGIIIIGVSIIGGGDKLDKTN
jgi:multidrug transporter EmrE-like cation transporter